MVREIFKVSQISLIFMPLSLRMVLAIRILGLSGAIGFLPPLRPLALAASSPAWVLSWINRRSN